jgi:hypothetical protein
MSTTDSSAATGARATPYAVVALKPVPSTTQTAVEENIVPCAYFDSHWERVSSQDLSTRGDSHCIRFVDHGRKVPAWVIEELNGQGQPPDFDVCLFAAVAKTFRISCGLPNTFLACKDGDARIIDIPVQFDTARGVVLVFSKPSQGGTDRIIATADPEIRNGSRRDV